MGSVFKKGNKWRGQYTAPDGSRISKTFKRQWQAQEWVNENEGQIKADTWIAPSEITLGAWIEDFIEVYRYNAESATKEGYKQSINRIKKFVPDLLDIPIQQLRQVDMQRAANTLRDHRHSRTCKITLSLIRSALEEAVKHGMIKNNPCTRIKIKESLESYGGKEIEPQTLAALIERLKGDVQKRSRPYCDLLLFLIGTGMRTQEARALRVEDIRINGIYVATALDRSGKRKATKTKESKRFIPLTNELLALLKHRASQSINGLIFETTTGKPLGHRNIARSLSTYSNGKASPHDLRHTFVTNAIRNGANLKALSKITGDSIETLLKVYSHVNESDLLDVIKKAKPKPHEKSNIIEYSRTV